MYQYDFYVLNKLESPAAVLLAIVGIPHKSVLGFQGMGHQSKNLTFLVGFLLWSFLWNGTRDSGDGRQGAARRNLFRAR
jgi:hypothetical protein